MNLFSEQISPVPWEVDAKSCISSVEKSKSSSSTPPHLEKDHTNPHTTTKGHDIPPAIVPAANSGALLITRGHTTLLSRRFSCYYLRRQSFCNIKTIWHDNFGLLFCSEQLPQLIKREFVGASVCLVWLPLSMAACIQSQQWVMTSLCYGRAGELVYTGSNGEEPLRRLWKVTERLVMTVYMCEDIFCCLLSLLIERLSLFLQNILYMSAIPSKELTNK